MGLTDPAAVVAAGAKSHDLEICSEGENCQRPLGEQRSTRLGELYEGSALVQLEPAVLDRAIKPGLVFRRRALELEQKRPVDLLDIDPAVLDGLERVGELKQLARGSFRIGKRKRSVANFIVA
jgi:hypothetical protein